MLSATFLLNSHCYKVWGIDKYLHYFYYCVSIVLNRTNFWIFLGLMPYLKWFKSYLLGLCWQAPSFFALVISLLSLKGWFNGLIWTRISEYIILGLLLAKLLWNFYISLVMTLKTQLHHKLEKSIWGQQRKYSLIPSLFIQWIQLFLSCSA